MGVEAAEEAAGKPAEDAARLLSNLQHQQLQVACGLRLLMASLSLTLLLLVDDRVGECFESLHWELPVGVMSHHQWRQLHLAQLAQHWTFAQAMTGVLTPDCDAAVCLKCVCVSLYKEPWLHVQMTWAEDL